MKNSALLRRMGKNYLLGKWFAVTSKDVDGNMRQHVIYCVDITENGVGRFITAEPVPAGDLAKLSFSNFEGYDMKPINNFVCHYFNTLLEKITFKKMKYSKLMQEVIFSTCFAMVTDEKLYGDDCFSISKYATNEVFDRIREEKADTEELKNAYCAVQKNMIVDLCRYLILYRELNGITEHVKKLVRPAGFRSFLTVSEWAEEKEWCSSHPIVYLDDSTL